MQFRHAVQGRLGKRQKMVAICMVTPAHMLLRRLHALCTGPQSSTDKRHLSQFESFLVHVQVCSNTAIRACGALTARLSILRERVFGLSCCETV